MHRHHLLPKRMGGTDAEENLTPPISCELHAEFHRDLWEHYGQQGDYIAWKALSGRITGEDARLHAALDGQSKSEKYKASRRTCGLRANSTMTKETRSKGGKAASIHLVAWIKNNPAAHRAQCAVTGRLNAEKQKIAHTYNGVFYQSKKALQLATGLSNTGFYGKLNRGVIKRIDKVAS